VDFRDSGVYFQDSRVYFRDSRVYFRGSRVYFRDSRVERNFRRFVAGTVRVYFRDSRVEWKIPCTYTYILFRVRTDGPVYGIEAWEQESPVHTDYYYDSCAYRLLL
jgi:hypothetical protein